MVQIKHFTALQKMPNFQFSRRAKWPWQDKILGTPPARPENYCESKQTYVVNANAETSQFYSFKGLFPIGKVHCQRYTRNLNPTN